MVIPHHDDFNLFSYSLEAWIRVPKITGDWQGIVAKDGWPLRNYGIWVFNNMGQVHHSFNTGDNNVTVDTKADVVDNKWHHIAATYDKKMQRTYVDGKLDAERPATEKPGISEVDVYIGRGSVGWHQLIGAIDEVRISDKALSEAEIKKSVEEGLLPVESKAKLAISWGYLKAYY